MTGRVRPLEGVGFGTSLIWACLGCPGLEWAWTRDLGSAWNEHETHEKTGLETVSGPEKRQIGYEAVRLGLCPEQGSKVFCVITEG